MNKSRLLRASCAATIMLFAIPATASVIYQYAGSPYTSIATGNLYDTSMTVTGYFELPTALAPDLNFQIINPISFSFSDGVNTLTQLDATYGVFQLTTNQTGNLVEWNININNNFPNPVQTGDRRIFIRTSASQSGLKINDAYVEECTATSLGSGGTTLCDTVTQIDLAENDFLTAGTWTVSSASSVPIPAAAWLFGSGLLGLVGIARRKS